MAKIIFFAPHSLLWVHAFPEGVVAESLMKSKHDIVYITCGGALNSACICLGMKGVGPDSPDAKRAEVCGQCSSRAHLIQKEMKLPGYSLSSASLPEDDEKVKAVLASVSPSNFSEFALEGIPIGKITAYEILIQYKKMNADLSEKEWQQYYSKLKSAVKAFYILKRIFDKEKPDYAISYNSLYSVNAVFTELARMRGAAPYFMHAGGNLSDRLSTLSIGRDSALVYIKEILKRWPMVQNLPCNEGLLTEATGHFLELLRGRNVFAYSAPKSKTSIDVRKMFGVIPQQKVLVATMSSYDETFAAEFVGACPKVEGILFKTQLEWVQALVKWVQDKPEYFLIIRVHPRDFPNKRDRSSSKQASVLRSLFVDLPKNVKVNWPEDGLSLYDLACETDVFLNAWSSVGVEMSLLGLPVVIYSKEEIGYPSDLNYLGETEVEYFVQIEQALKDGWNFERVRKTYRWLSLLFGRSQIRIEESYNGPPLYENIFQRKFAGGMRKLFPLLEEWQDCRKRSRDIRHAEALSQMFIQGASTSFDTVNLQRGSVSTMEEETAFIKLEMARIAKALWGDIENTQRKSNGKLFLQFRNYLSDPILQNHR